MQFYLHISLFFCIFAATLHTTIDMTSNFFTNENQNTLLEKIEGVFQYKKVHFFDALVGYFRASGYSDTPRLGAYAIFFLDVKSR